MREQLIQYVNLLFAGTSGCEDIRQEILQNTLDRYDDLIAEGKIPEAAYRLAIVGIGDIHEILSAEQPPAAAPVPVQNTDRKKKMRAIAIGIYIISAIPLFLLSTVGLDTIGLCVTLLLVAAATILLLSNSNPENEDRKEAPEQAPMTPHQSRKETIGKLIFAIGLAVYLIISIKTEAWYITWLMFPIMSALNNLINATLDLWEAMKHEN